MARTELTTGKERIGRLLQAFTRDPTGVLGGLWGHMRQRRDFHVDYEVDESWEQKLHGMLGAPWPCPVAARIDDLIEGISVKLHAKGLRFGRHTYGGYSDADHSLARAAWCVTHHKVPEIVVETGVARGVTSQIILQALHENDRGNLWSIDLPHPLNHALHSQTAAAVSDAYRTRWSYIRGASRQRLPDLVSVLPYVDFFVHDSLHTAKNTRFEMDQVAAVLKPGGVMLIDDISTHDGFASFAAQHPGYTTVACASADRHGLFGIAVNAARD